MSENFADSAQEALKLAREAARRYGSRYVGTEHLLYGVLRCGDSIAEDVLSHLAVDRLALLATVEKVLEEAKTTTASHEAAATNASPDDEVSVEFTPHAKRVLELAQDEAMAEDLDFVGPEHILVALAREEEGVAALLLLEANLDKAQLKSGVRRIHGTLLKDSKDPEQEAEDLAPPARRRGHKRGGKQPEPVEDEGEWDSATVDASSTPKKSTRATNFLDQFSTDLTKLARKHKLDPVIGRAAELERMVQILTRRTKNNPVILGEPGVGKTALVEGLAQRIVDGEVPLQLRGTRLLCLDLPALVAGTKYRGEFEERLKRVMEELIKATGVMIFIDEIHTLVGVGASQGNLDAANILKPALSRGEIQLIGATTYDEYRRFVEKQGALERRFQALDLNPPSQNHAVLILKGLKDRYEAHHRVRISDEVIELAVELSSRYITNRFLPDKALDVIDEAGARLRLQRSRRPARVREIDGEIEKLQSEIEEEKQLDVPEQVSSRQTSLDDLQSERKRLLADWQRQAPEAACEITPKIVFETVGAMTGIPMQDIRDGEAGRLLRLGDELAAHVVGQPEAITKVTAAIQRSRSGLKNPRRPTGSFLFVGPSGVGKTLLAKALAEVLFGSRDAIIQLDMSEYSEKLAGSRLLGAPPGYAGHEEGGQLTEKVRRKPYSVILFDELEKAHPDTLNLLLSVLEEGHIQDGVGRSVDFRNTVVIMTSNVGSQRLRQKGQLGFNRQESSGFISDAAREDITNQLEQHFRPEFMNRIDHVVLFNFLGEEELLKIVDIEIAALAATLRNRDIDIHVSDDARRWLVSQHNLPNQGARPLKRFLESQLADPLAEKIILGSVTSGSRVEVSLGEAGLELGSSEPALAGA